MLPGVYREAAAGLAIPRQGSRKTVIRWRKAEDCHCPNDIKNAPIIILDEATAFTDPENENKIQKSIEELTKGKTLLVIAHRLSTITDADKIVVLKNGCIEGAGTQEELLQNCQLYQRMWQAHVGARHWAVVSQKEGEDSCLAL